MANDLIVVDLDTNTGEPPRSLYNAVKFLRQARDEIKKVRDWGLHSISVSDYSVFETRFGIPVGKGAAVFTLLDGTLQVLDATSSGYADELMARIANSTT